MSVLFGLRSRIEARIDNELVGEGASVRQRNVAGEHAGVTHFGDFGAVGIVGGVVEVVLPEAAFRAAFRRGDELIDNQFAGRDVAGKSLPVAARTGLETRRETGSACWRDP